MIYIYFIWFLAILIILNGVFGNFSSLGISLSLIGAGLAFALQQVILSFAAWFLIIMKSDPIRLETGSISRARIFWEMLRT